MIFLFGGEKPKKRKGNNKSLKNRTAKLISLEKITKQNISPIGRQIKLLMKQKNRNLNNKKLKYRKRQDNKTTF